MINPHAIVVNSEASPYSNIRPPIEKFRGISRTIRSQKL